MKNRRLTEKVETSLLLLYMVLASSGEVKAQKSPQPTPTSGTNWVSYDEALRSYVFHGNGVEYLYSVEKGGSFNGLTARVIASNVIFHPSYFGGIRAILGGVETNPWDPGVTFGLLDRHLQGDGLMVHWVMKAHGDSFAYRFMLNIVGNTLVVDVEADSTASHSAMALDLDRSYGSDGQAHYIIGIPYLVLFNVLLCDGVFTTFFFDWEVSDASQLFPQNSYHSRSSAYFAQTAMYNKKTDGKRNVLKERLYLTVSPNLEDVLPNIPNPVSQYKRESANRMLWFYNGPMDSCLVHLDRMYQRGVRNLWLQIHEWQRAGFDKEYPDVMPASFVHYCDIIGGQGGAHNFLSEVGKRAKTYGYLFGLHENYVDFYPSAPSWNERDVALAAEGRRAPAYLNPCNNSREQSSIMKPSRAASYLNQMAPMIHQAYHTSASYLDVHSSISPGDRVDYDAKVVNAGMFRETMKLYRDLARQARINHAGPVQGEGDVHVLYQGYYDDIEARILTGTTTTNSGYGYRAPLLVDFDIRKLHSKTVAHGVGNYELFFGPMLNQWLMVTGHFLHRLPEAGTLLETHCWHKPMYTKCKRPMPSLKRP
jgi:hypothetical protein